MRKSSIMSIAIFCLAACLLEGCGDSGTGMGNADVQEQQEMAERENPESEDRQEQEGDADDVENSVVKETLILK